MPAIEFEWLRARLLPHLIDVCKGVEIAVGRRLPMLRTTVAAKLTRDAALNALKVAGASALIDNVPVVGAFLGAFVSAGDMMAITGIQMMLMLQIRATFGKDPDVAQMWELLPIVGGGFGWRALARELSGLHSGRRHPDQIGDRLRGNGRRRRRRDVLRTARPAHGEGRRCQSLRRRARVGAKFRARRVGAHPRQRFALAARAADDARASPTSSR